MPLPVLRQSSKPKLTFEKSYWEKAGADFIKYLDTEKNIKDPNKVREIVKDVSTIDEAISSIEETKGKGKDSYGDKVSKVLNNMHYFLDLGDIAVKGGPESVGIVWMGFKMIFAGIQADYKACQLLADISSTALGLMIQCRVYGAMFDYHENPTKDETGALGEVQKCIRAAYLGILKFSYRSKTYVERHSLLRELKAIVVDPNFKKDAENIDDLGGKLRMFAGVAIQRRVDDNQGAMLENDQYLMQIAEVQLNENRAEFEALKTELSQIAEEVHVVREKVDIIADGMAELKEKWKGPSPEQLAEEKYEKNSKALWKIGQLDQTYANTVQATAMTCRWIFEHAEYKSWIESRNGILWLHGGAGTRRRLPITNE
jgi:hypothetical protein